ncbi:putative Tryptophan synthase B-subunit [Streptomyces sp. KY75]|nr:putative Tryptophan synthase B-subunit [Streptomyces sp. KY70]CAD5995376.1 putative Tryptophan synthase B-subunit [Streptomyces sp. KY75]
MEHLRRQRRLPGDERRRTRRRQVRRVHQRLLQPGPERRRLETPPRISRNRRSLPARPIRHLTVLTPGPPWSSRARAGAGVRRESSPRGGSTRRRLPLHARRRERLGSRIGKAVEAAALRRAMPQPAIVWADHENAVPRMGLPDREGAQRDRPVRQPRWPGRLRGCWPGAAGAGRGRP